MIRAGNREGELLRRIREYVRGHGVVSSAEIRRLHGSRGAKKLAVQCNRGEFVLLARGIAALPGITMKSPEYREFLNRRTRQVTEGDGNSRERLMAWAATRGEFTLGEARDAVGVHLDKVPAMLIEQGDIVRVARGVYKATRGSPRPLRARLRLPQEVTSAVAETAGRLIVFCAADMPEVGTARQRRSAVAALLAAGKAKKLECGIYAMTGSDPTPDMIEAARRRVGRRVGPVEHGGRNIEEWASQRGVFSGMDAERAFNHGVWSTLYRMTSEGIMRRVGRRFELVPENERQNPNKSDDVTHPAC